METTLCAETLERENAAFRDTGGRSEENRDRGFVPAFIDTETETIYRSCFANGLPAPFHSIDGLPEEVVVARTPAGRVARVKVSVVSGFVRDGRFYTREVAVRMVSPLN